MGLLRRNKKTTETMPHQPASYSTTTSMNVVNAQGEVTSCPPHTTLSATLSSLSTSSTIVSSSDNTTLSSSTSSSLSYQSTTTSATVPNIQHPTTTTTTPSLPPTTTTATTATSSSRFQWVPGMADDYLFDEEVEIIKALRQAIPQLKHESDKFIAAFLFAKNHDITATTTVLQTFFKTKQTVAKYFPNQHLPSFKYSNLREIISPGGMSMIQPLGFRDNNNRMIRHILLENERASKRTLDSALLACIWQTYYLTAIEPLNAWRNGTVMILDMKHAGLKNIDFSPKGVDILKSMQDVFPFHLTEIVVVNGGIFFSSILATAKVLFPKRFTDMVTVKKVSEMNQIIPPQWLLRHYGGNANYWLEDYMNEVLTNEEALFAKGVSL